MSFELKSFGEVVEYAIAREEEAVDFYEQIAESVADEAIRKEALSMAAEEEKHKELLEEITPETIDVQEVKVSTVTMGLADWTVPNPLTDQADFQDLIIIAMKREAESAKLYRELAQQTNNPELKALFEKLAVDESAHLDHFENLYDSNFLIEN